MATAFTDMWPNNLWPENLNELAFESPKFHMLQQAAILGERTRHVLDGKLVTYEEPGGKLIRHDFTVIAPTLRYRFVLFSVQHAKVPAYPALVRYVSAAAWPPEVYQLKTKDPESTFEVKNEEEFMRLMKFILSNKDTLEILQTLISQSQEKSWPTESNAVMNQ